VATCEVSGGDDYDATPAVAAGYREVMGWSEDARTLADDATIAILSAAAGR